MKRLIRLKVDRELHEVTVEPWEMLLEGIEEDIESRHLLQAHKGVGWLSPF